MGSSSTSLQAGPKGSRGSGGVPMRLTYEKGKFILTNASSLFYLNIGAVRSASEKLVKHRLFIYIPYAFGLRFQQYKSVKFSPKENKVQLGENGDLIPDDVVVFADGSYGDLTLLNSGAVKTVVVIGGGAVGVEVAAEIAADFKNIQVTLVHHSDNLVSDTVTEKFQMGLQDKLLNKGVTLVLGERVVNLPDEGVSGPCEIRTDKGTTLTADLVYKCVGVREANSDDKQDTTVSAVPFGFVVTMGTNDGVQMVL